MSESFHVNDKVTVDSARWPGIWVVTKVNPVTCKLTQGTNRLTANKLVMRPASEATATVTDVPIRNTFYCGTIVRPTQGKAAGKLLTVIRDNSDRITAVELGGNNGNYWKIPAAWLKVIPAADLKDYL